MQECYDRPDVSPEGIRQRYTTLKELGDGHAAAGRTHPARRCYEMACELAPEESGPYVGLGAVAVQDSRYDEARRSFEIARRLEPDCAEAYGGLAMVHQECQDYPAAFEMYLRCLELDTDNLMALLGLFQTSCQMGTFEKIVHYLEVYLKTHSDDTAVLFCLATLYARDGKLETAGRTLRRVLEIEPRNFEAAKLLAQVTRSLVRLRPPEVAAL